MVEAHIVPSAATAELEMALSLLAVVLCVIIGGLMSGLTVGLLSLDPLNLKVIEQNGSPQDKANAAKVRPLIEQHHLLLVTLLLTNATAMESLPLFLDRLVPQWAAVALSVTLVLLFGEVIPQAICTGPNRLAIGAALVPLVRACILITAIVSYPLAKLLDCALGDEHGGKLYARGELKALIGLHVSHGAPGGGGGGGPAGQRAARGRTGSAQHGGTGGEGGGGALADAERGEGSTGRAHCARQSSAARPGAHTAHSTTGDGGDGDAATLGAARAEPLRDGARGADSEGAHAPRRSSLAQPSRDGADGADVGGQLEAAGGLLPEEATIISQVLDAPYKFAHDAMVLWEDAVLIENNAALDAAMLTRVVRSGRSRLPVFEAPDVNDIRGLLLVNHLVELNGAECRPLSSLPLVRPVIVSPYTPLFALLDEFQKGRCHMALVTEQWQLARACIDARLGHLPPGAGADARDGGADGLAERLRQSGRWMDPAVCFLGLVTIEDVLEELIGEEIEDEADLARRAAGGTASGASTPRSPGGRASGDGNTVVAGHSSRELLSTRQLRVHYAQTQRQPRMHQPAAARSAAAPAAAAELRALSPHAHRSAVRPLLALPAADGTSHLSVRVPARRGTRPSSASGAGGESPLSVSRTGGEAAGLGSGAHSPAEPTLPLVETFAAAAAAEAAAAAAAAATPNPPHSVSAGDGGGGGASAPVGGGLGEAAIVRLVLKWERRMRRRLTGAAAAGVGAHGDGASSELAGGPGGAGVPPALAAERALRRASSALNAARVWRAAAAASSGVPPAPLGSAATFTAPSLLPGGGVVAGAGTLGTAGELAGEVARTRWQALAGGYDGSCASNGSNGSCALRPSSARALRPPNAGVAGGACTRAPEEAGAPIARGRTRLLRLATLPSLLAGGAPPSPAAMLGGALALVGGASAGVGACAGAGLEGGEYGRLIDEPVNPADRPAAHAPIDAMRRIEDDSEFFAAMLSRARGGPEP
ncbi:hypothetical protein KFE25_011957 [Diacronema lutheri]|uniref:CNNM transmembrane domain-containing protein n=1 Tax=Diacronema lutheri TaxID=2081491 RepID=A0A8J5X468_DIALT|nr:hypothetical protein KFE25_011957 [Diacronema lutheri]